MLTGGPQRGGADAASSARAEGALSVLYEDADVLAVAKASGVATIPGRGIAAPSLVRLGEVQRGERLFVVHRLDRPVSGVVLFAKNPAAHRRLCAAFSRGEVVKRYVALVRGRLEAEGGVVDAPLRTFASGRVGVDPERGKPSATAYSVMERLEGFTLLSVRPFTGRRHQIRVHLSHIGHPIAGDLLYGPRNTVGAFPRLMLHGARIEFTDPAGRPIAVDAPLPPCFRSVLERVRRCT